MFRKLSALLAGVLLCSLASSQSVPNGGVITTGQVWTVAQWNNAWQSKFDVTGGTLTAPTINNPTISGGTQSTPAISSPAITGGTQSAPAITSPTISGTVLGSPTMTGNWTFQPASGTGLNVNGIPGQFAQILNGTTSTGNSFGLLISGGTTATDIPFVINNAANTLQFFEVLGDGGVVLGSPTGGNLGLGTLNATNLFKNGATVPAINQSPTWTGNHTFSGTVFAGVSSPTIPFGGGSVASINGGPTGFASSAVVIAGGTGTNNIGLAVVSRSSGEGLTVNGQNVTGLSHGLTVIAGTNSSDANTGWANATGGNLGGILGDGSLVMGTPTGGGQGLGTVNATLFDQGNRVLTNVSATSNLTSLGTLGGLNVSGTANVGALIASNFTLGGVTVNPQLTAHVATNQSTTSTSPVATALALTLPVGFYAIEIFLDFNGTSTGTQGIKLIPNGGTAVVTGVLGSAVGSVAGTPINGNSASNFTFSNISVATSTDFLMIKYPLPVTTAGTYIVTLAQNSSSANATNLIAGSYISATRLN